MKKEYIIIICIIVVVIGGNLFAQKYTEKSVEMMSDKIEEMIPDIIEGNNDDLIKQKYEKISQIWESRFTVLAYYIEHDELEKVKTELVTLQANLEVREYEKGLEELEKCKYILEHIEEKENFALMNVF